VVEEQLLEEVAVVELEDIDFLMEQHPVVIQLDQVL
tara:strand:- start:459 stop:566 length:108 start_codon:yes stop_codon:yes gene_type:complete